MRRRNTYLELMRFLFSVGICLYHWGNGHFGGAYIGVQFFFVLSGFLLAAGRGTDVSESDAYKNCVLYLKRRICRFYPHFIFSFVVLMIIKIVVVHSTSFHDFLLTAFWEVTFLQNIGLTSSVVLLNAPTWYLSAVIISGYFIYYLLQKYHDLYLYILSPLSIMIMLCYFNYRWGSMAAASHVVGITTAGLIQGFACMSLGCLSFKIFQQLDTKIKKDSYLFCLLQSAMEIFFLGLVFLMSYREGHTSKDFVLIMIFAILIMSAALDSSIISKVCNFAIIREVILRLGKISYAVFLNHMAILIFVRQIWNPFRDSGYFLQTALFICLTLLYSFVTDWIVRTATPFITRLMTSLFIRNIPDAGGG